MYLNAGEKSTPHRDPHDPPRRRANKRPGHGTMDNDRPPIIQIISRDTGEERGWVVGRAPGAICKGITAEAIPRARTIVSRTNTAAITAWGQRTRR